jgi:hypothetical protein
VTSLRRFLPLASLILALMAIGGGVLYAQLEGGDRGIPPVDSASTYEVTDVAVDVSAPNSEQARYEGWREAQSRGWRALWAKMNGQPASAAPDLSDTVLDSIVSGIVIEDEQIGPKRYIATLGVLFDRARAGQLLGVHGVGRRSAPMLVIPVMITGSSAQSFESRNEWQRAWARFRTGNSAIDYVRPTGSGIDPLLLNLSQARRPGRGWWRMLLDQYGASDVIMAEVQLRRLYPGGPAIGIFTARHGPDGIMIGRFTLRVESSNLIPRMFDVGIQRLDGLYTQALGQGQLRPDPSLTIVEPVVAPPPPETSAEPVEETVVTGPILRGIASAFRIQVDTPNAGSVGQAELAVSRIPGVTSALTTSLALGGTSVMRVTFTGNLDQLQAALQGQGWAVQNGGGTLRISRGGGEGQ